MTVLGVSCNPLLDGRDRNRPLWRIEFTAPPRSTDGTPATDGQRVYVYVDGITAFDAETGTRVWTNPTPGVRSRPKNLLVRNGRVFGAGGAAVALDSESGRELWKFPLSSSGHASAGLGRAAVDDATFYVGTDAHQVFALDQVTGSLRWMVDIGPDWEHRGIVTGVTVSGDTVFVSARQYNAENGYISTGWIIGLDRATGKRVWSFRNGDGTDWRTVAAGVSVAGSLLLASDHLSGAVFAVDRTTGIEVWRRIGPADRFGSLASPVPVGNTAYHASMDAYVYALDVATGALRWKTENSGGHLSFVLCGKLLFANFMSLAILDRTSGRVQSRIGVPEIFSDFAVEGNRAFAVSDRAVYAYRCD
ncbi:PQQ-binding-like beta-propeller repeat protein [Longimicrobium sp.]|jgi:outer membrane protein assembly factor BamB|uniref:PQQ-binding-like beta-propeller repeat protein n=1 Tax=Longimicrobium sp. TaxID=2029185 RepID=UPI002ED9D029